MDIVTASDGVTLAVHRYTEIDPSRPTILAIHGWPDNHHVWDGVAEQFSERYSGKYNFVAYDVRGAGESSCPASRSGYKFPQLVSDICAVIDSLGVGQVHLLAHDWGSIQAWPAVTDDSVMGRIASFTSISGPHLRYARMFLLSARTPGRVAQVARQLVASSYIAFFLTPVVPELTSRLGLLAKIVAALERVGRSSARSQHRPAQRTIADFVNGLNLYRQNMLESLLSGGSQLPQTTVGVQVLVPRKDIFVTAALQRFTGAIPQGPQKGRVIPIEGGHWVVASRPDVIARLTGEWVDQNASGAAQPDEPAVRGAPREVRGKLALVTGAGAGIGRATAVELARQGARKVVIVDRDLDAGFEAADAVRAACAEAAVYRVDVSDEAAMNDLAAQVLNDHGVVDILVNNAGIAIAGRFLETSSANWDAIMGINVRGVIAGSRAFGAQMVERGQGGTIINIASAAAFLPSKSMVAYSYDEGGGARVQCSVACRPGRRRHHRDGGLPGLRQHQYRQKHCVRGDERRTAGARPPEGGCGLPAPQLRTGSHRQGYRQGGQDRPTRVAGRRGGQDRLRDAPHQPFDDPVVGALRHSAEVVL